jgi:hypothetical protein
MLTNIQSLFADILQTPQQRAMQLTNEGLARSELATRGLSGGASMLSPLIAAEARSAPMREEMLSRSLGRLFGQDVRTESESIQNMLSQADTTTVEGASALAEMLRKQGYGAQAAEIDTQVAAKRQEQALLQKSQESSLDMIKTAGLDARSQAMLINLVGNNPSIDPMKVFEAIQEMGGVPDSVKALQARAAMVFEVGSDEYNAYVARGGMEDTGNESANARERRIEDIQSTFGINRQQAIQRLEANTVLDPTTGNLIQQDLATGEYSAVPINIPSSQRTVGEPPAVDINQISFDPALGGGIVTGLQNLWNVTAGQVPFLDVATNRTDAQQQLRFLERDAISALASSSRPPVVEQERIAALLPQPGQWLQNPREAREKVVGFVDVMVQQYVDDLRYVSDPSVPNTLKRDINVRINSVERVVRRVLTPEAADKVFEAVNTFEGQRNSILEMPLSEINSLDITSLTDAELAALEERLKNE